MNIKGNLKYTITSSIVFLLIYMFVAAIPIGPDLYFEPGWTRDLTQPLDSPDTPLVSSDLSRPEAFILGSRFGYFAPDGRILRNETSNMRISVSPWAWAVYPQDARGTGINFTDGSPKMTISESGYVHLDDDRVFLFLPGGNGIRQYDRSGVPMWTREHTAPITAFNSSPAGAVIGYADGNLSFIRTDGTEAFSFYPGGSNSQVILGASVSEDGTLVACVSGLERQRFLLVKVTGNQHKILHHTWLEGDLDRQVYVNFEQKGRYVFFETSRGLGVMDCKRLTDWLVKIPGRIVTTGECPGDSIFLVLSKEGDGYALSAVERPNHLVASTRFAARDAFLLQRGTSIYLGTDSSISRINIRGLE